MSRGVYDLPPALREARNFQFAPKQMSPDNPVFGELMSRVGPAMAASPFASQLLSGQMGTQMPAGMPNMQPYMAALPAMGGSAQPSISPISHPMQGAAQMANAAVDKFNSNPKNQFPTAPGGGGAFSGLFGLGSRLMGRGGGLY